MGAFLGALVVSSCFLAGCHPAALIIPSYIQSVGVELVQNKTSQFGLETLFTQAIIREFQTDGRLPIEDPDKADLTVRIIIHQFDQFPVFNDTTTNATLQYRLSVTYDLAAVDKREKKTFVEDDKKVHSYYYYSPLYVGAITQTEDQAITQMADDMAHLIVRRVLEGY